jgi:predicted DsbA family dithiol-disulfide isomerase
MAAEGLSAPLPLPSDFVADPVCPWCYLGWARLQAALAQRPDLDARIAWRAYQLDPTIPEGGVERQAYLAAKFGDSGGWAEMEQHILQAAADAGLDMKLNQIPVRPNTAAAQRLIHWAQAEGKGPAAAEAVMAAYWSELKDIGDLEVLAEIAAGLGMDRAAVLERLRSGADREAVDQEHATAVRLGVSGVPFMVFAGRVAVSGAHSPENLLAAIEKAMEPAA